MNILHICSTYPPDIGGTATSVPCLAEQQADSGHNVIILTHGTPTGQDDNKFKTYRCGKIQYRTDNITGGLKKSIKMSQLGKKILKENKIDIIHVHDPNVSAITKLLIDPQSKIPSVIKYSGDLAWETLGLKSKKYIQKQNKFWTSPQAKTILAIERIIFSRFDKILAQNKYQTQMLKKHLKIKEKKISIIPNGIKVYKYTAKDIETAKKTLPKAKLRICSAARLVPWKGIENMIKTIKHIDAKYIIFGDGPYKKHLEDIAEKYNVSEKVTFYGKLPAEKIQLYIRTCDILIVPSTYEPFGIIILEGFAANTPVIASNTGGIPELISSNNLFNQNNPREIKEKIRYTQKNKAKIIETQNRKLKNYSWKNISEKTQVIYEKITKKTTHA